MMCFRELRIFLQLIDQAIVCLRLLDSQPGKKRDEEKHSDDGNVVRRRGENPELVPVRDRPQGKKHQDNNHPEGYQLTFTQA